MSHATAPDLVDAASSVRAETAASGPMAEAIGKMRAHFAEPLNRTSLSLVASMVLTAGLGVGFWAAAARLYSPAAIGRSSALIAALTAIASLCQLNLTNVIVRFLPQIHKRIGLRVSQAYAAAAVASIAVASAFVFLAPVVTHQFTFLRRDTWLAVGFVLSTTAWTVFSLQDSVLTALRKATWVPVENGIFSAAKLALLPVTLALVGVLGVFAAWVAPMFVAIVVVNVLIARKVVPAAAAAQKEAIGVVDVLGWRRLIAFLAQDFLGAAIGQVVMTALPLLVVSLLGTEANAYFYVPFTLIITFDLMFGAVATSLTAEAARAPHRLHEFMGIVRRRFMFVQLPLALALVAAAPLVLAVFGPAYVQHSTTVLRLLALASCFRGVAALFAATARLRGSGTQLLTMQLASLLLLIPLTLILVHHERVDGVALAWLATSIVVAAGVAPNLWRFTRKSRLTDRHAGVSLADKEMTMTTSLSDQHPASWLVADSLVSGAPVADGQLLTNGQLPASVFRHMEPTEIAVVDLESGLVPSRPAPDTGPDAPLYRDALLLVRMHGEPLRIIDLPRPLAALSPPELGAAIWSRCADAIAHHARRCGCSPVPRGVEDLEHLGHDCAANAAAPSSPSVAIIVPTGGRTEQLARMLESLLSNIPDLPEVIVVDNRPGMGDTAEVVASFARRNSGVRYVAEARPGSSVARNRGLAETDAEIVVFTDDDVVVDADWLRWLLVPFERAEVGAVTGMVLPLCLNVAAQKHFEQYAGFSKGLRAREYDLNGNRAADRLLYPYWGGVFGSGNSMAFRRRQLVAAGGFDPALGAGSVALAGADIEAMSAAVLRGTTLVYEPRSVCWHEHRHSDEALARQLFNYGVGFTAILTKALLTDPRFVASVARSLPLAMRLRRRRAAGGESPTALPSHLAKLQHQGMRLGPWLYLKSRRWARRLDLDAVIAGR